MDCRLTEWIGDLRVGWTEYTGMYIHEGTKFISQAVGIKNRLDFEIMNPAVYVDEEMFAFI
jgi:hypothetical protein